MADYAVATARITYNAAALATMGTDSTWDAAVTRLLAAQALADADSEYGASAAASEAGQREHLRLSGKYGPAWRSMPHVVAEARKNLGAYASSDDDWTRDFCEAVWQAQRDLALVPAPTFAAAMFKAACLSDSEVWNDNRFPHNCMAILQADLARFTAPTAASQPSTSTQPDADILAAWERRKAAHARLRAMPDEKGPGFDPMDQMDDAQRGCWAVIDDAETVIGETVATTPQGIACQLFSAISHIVTDRREDEAANNGDLDGLMADNEAMDWDAKLLLAALRGLRAMGSIGTGNADARAKWNDMVARYRALEAERVTDDASIDAAGDLIAEIMAMPAPDAAAARWKLDHLLNDGRGSTGSYDAAYVAQTIADYQRFLGGEA